MSEKIDWDWAEKLLDKLKREQDSEKRRGFVRALYRWILNYGRTVGLGEDQLRDGS